MSVRLSLFNIVCVRARPTLLRADGKKFKVLGNTGIEKLFSTFLECWKEYQYKHTDYLPKVKLQLFGYFPGGLFCSTQIPTLMLYHRKKLCCRPPT